MDLENIIFLPRKGILKYCFYSSKVGEMGFLNLYSYYVHPPGGWIYYFCFFRRPMSGVTHGFRSFKGKVLELLSPNLVCRLIGSVACLGLLLAVVPLLLTE